MVFFKRKKLIKVKDSNDVEEKTIIRKLSSAMRIQVRVTPDTKFRIVSNPSNHTVSFELCDYPGYVMRERGLKELFGERRNLDKQNAPEISFVPMPNLWFDGYISFESSWRASYYIRMKDNQIYMDQYERSKDFKEEASFIMTRKSPDGRMVRVHSWVDSMTSRNDDEEDSDEKKRIRFLVDIKDEKDYHSENIPETEMQKYQPRDFHQIHKPLASTPSKGILKSYPQPSASRVHSSSSARLKERPNPSHEKRSCKAKKMEGSHKPLQVSLSKRKTSSISERERLIHTGSDSNAGSLESRFLDDDTTVLSTSFTDLSMSEEENDIKILQFLDYKDNTSSNTPAYYLAHTKRTLPTTSQEDSQTAKTSKPRTRKYGVAYSEYRIDL